jgi:NAD(P)-dependent dehydrogenase (short-subunit alcohol dehydrogenase family)
MATALITGTSRGLGNEFCRQLQARGWTVHACARSAADVPDLPGVVGHSLDVSDFQAIDRLSRALADISIDLLINNAGIGPRHDSDLGALDYELWRRVLDVNTLAPIKMIEAFIDQIARSDRKLVVSISSELGSLSRLDEKGLGRSGAWLPYRVSKAALNMAHLSIKDPLAARGLTAVLLHPGWVATALGGMSAPTPPAASVNALLDVIDRLTTHDHGRFLGYDDREIPW